MPANHKPTLGIIGTGRLGMALTRLALQAGYEVRVVNSKGPASLTLILSVLAPAAQAAEIAEVIKLSDLVVLALPLGRYNSLEPSLFAGKIIIDATNYWPPTEGVIPEFAGEVSSSEVLQRYFADASVVKTLGHIAYNELEDQAVPSGSPQRRAVAMASDNAIAKEIVGQVIDNLGFDVVDLGPLAVGKAFQPDTILFNARYTAEELKRLA